MKILLPVLIFIGLGLLMGALLALASKLFAVKKDEKAEAIKECLPALTAEDADIPAVTLMPLLFLRVTLP